MVQSTQKIIKIGTSIGVTLPAKDLKKQNIKIGDDVEVIVRTMKFETKEDKKIISEAKKILNTYKKDFDNLSQRLKY